jgi:hypothetical protein
MGKLQSMINDKTNKNKIGEGNMISKLINKIKNNNNNEGDNMVNEDKFLKYKGSFTGNKNSGDIKYRFKATPEMAKKCEELGFDENQPMISVSRRTFKEIVKGCRRGRTYSTQSAFGGTFSVKKYGKNDYRCCDTGQRVHRSGVYNQFGGKVVSTNKNTLVGKVIHSLIENGMDTSINEISSSLDRIASSPELNEYKEVA